MSQTIHFKCKNYKPLLCSELQGLTFPTRPWGLRSTVPFDIRSPLSSRARPSTTLGSLKSLQKSNEGSFALTLNSAWNSSPQIFRGPPLPYLNPPVGLNVLLTVRGSLTMRQNSGLRWVFLLFPLHLIPSASWFSHHLTDNDLTVYCLLSPPRTKVPREREAVSSVGRAASGTKVGRHLLLFLE